ncbi:MAG: transketolase [Deltaproteobacteria bacterium]|nr:transketolase [Deltaproteobacteria bacterium]MBW1949538.1 transketolase [Deltaproteobacteria bacterium]MBW2346509.1 transketolase [Deltaproteobacteria bacterium]
MTDHRKTVVNLLIPHFRRDERYYLLVGDMGFGAIDRLRDEFPDRVINVGIMEQGATGIAAGMSMSGLIPIFYTIVNFLVFRALEQVRNDVVLQHLNVKFIATGVENYFQFLGPSHCCGRDDIKIMELIGMKVYDPYAGNVHFPDLVTAWITSQRPGYLRV